MANETSIHLLRQLSLPDRFEGLYEKVGPEIARVLVKPQKETDESFEKIALSVNARSEGFFVPLYASSGTGKTTLARSLSIFYPSSYSPSQSYAGEITYEALTEAVSSAIGNLKADDHRIVPLNIDHRESAPPTDTELSTIKRFLRNPSPGSRCVLLWPETNRDKAISIADRYIQISGKSPIKLPVDVQGPIKESWSDIALSTLEIVNNVSSISDLGVDPRTYNPDEFSSIGNYLREISNDFTLRLHELISSNKKAITLVVVFPSASSNAGVLTQLTSSTYFGLLDAHALLAGTKDSVIGRWWRDHRGTLTQTILQLNAHAFCLPPASSISILRNLGSDDVQKFLGDLDVRKQGPKRMIEDIARTDLGKFLRGESRSSFEARGTPAGVSTPAFELLAEKYGLTHGKDKVFNSALANGLNSFFQENGITYNKITSEKGLGFCPLIPDNAIHYDNDVTCIEYAWRSGDFLITGKRSEVSQYILTKLRNYARELGWVTD